jgi:hypothetical protein
MYARTRAHAPHARAHAAVTHTRSRARARDAEARTVAFERAQLAAFEITGGWIGEHDVDREHRAAIEVGWIRQRAARLHDVMLHAAHCQRRVLDALEDASATVRRCICGAQSAQQLL